MGYDVECVIGLHTYPREFFCVLCGTLACPNEALQAACSHLFCKPCLQYIAYGSRVCPCDGYLVTESNSKLIIDSNKRLAELISKVKVHCLYLRSGCTWQGDLSNCTSHCSGCVFGNVPVKCNTCGLQMMHRQVKEHAQSCSDTRGISGEAGNQVPEIASNLQQQLHDQPHAVYYSNHSHHQYSLVENHPFHHYQPQSHAYSTLNAPPFSQASHPHSHPQTQAHFEAVYPSQSWASLPLPQSNHKTAFAGLPGAIYPPVPSCSGQFSYQPQPTQKSVHHQTQDHIAVGHPQPPTPVQQDKNIVLDGLSQACYPPGSPLSKHSFYNQHQQSQNLQQHPVLPDPPTSRHLKEASCIPLHGIRRGEAFGQDSPAYLMRKFPGHGFMPGNYDMGDTVGAGAVDGNVLVVVGESGGPGNIPRHLPLYESDRGDGSSNPCLNEPGMRIDISHQGFPHDRSHAAGIDSFGHSRKRKPARVVDLGKDNKRMDRKKERTSAAHTAHEAVSLTREAGGHGHGHESNP